MKKYLFLFIVPIIGLPLLIWNFYFHNHAYQPPELLLIEPWKQYIDPDGYFSVSIPYSWPVDISSYEWIQRIGGNPDPFNYQERTISFGIPNNVENDFIFFFVKIDKPSNDCIKTIKKIINNFPMGDEMHFSTNIADYYLGYEYPGQEFTLPHPLNPPPPFVFVRGITPEFSNANQKVIDRIISSFKIYNQKPIYCKQNQK